MRGTVAKRIRRGVYGDLSHRQRQYNYASDRMMKQVVGEMVRMVRTVGGTVRNTGLRAQYRQAKKEYRP